VQQPVSTFDQEQSDHWEELADMAYYQGLAMQEELDEDDIPISWLTIMAYYQMQEELDENKMSLATPPLEPLSIPCVEAAAKVIYSDAMIWAAANPNGGAVPPWVEGGNSTAQDVARQVARSLTTPPSKLPTYEEVQQLWRVLMKSPGAILAQPMYDFAYAVLEAWGNSKNQPSECQQINTSLQEDCT